MSEENNPSVKESGAQAENLAEKTSTTQPDRIDKIQRKLPWGNIFAHVCLSIGCLASFAVIGLCLYIASEKNNSRWLSNAKYLSFDTTEPLDIEPYIQGYNASVPPEYEAILKEQFTRLGVRANSYLTVSKDYNKYLFTIITLASITGIVAGSSLFYISKEGFEKANNYIINLFAITTGMVVLLTSLPLIYQYEENISNYNRGYIEHLNLENDIITMLATKELPEGVDGSQVDNDIDKIRHIIIFFHNELEDISLVGIEYDVSSIVQSDDLFNRLNDSEATFEDKF